MKRIKLPKRWILYVIALPASVAIWSGWVGLGGLCGFGYVNLLPGIGHGLHINTAITLPVGIEAYAAYALYIWVSASRRSVAVKDFAKKSAIGGLILGAFGQVFYHVLAERYAKQAPMPITVFVSVMPVAVLGAAAYLMHLLHAAEPVPKAVPQIQASSLETVPAKPVPARTSAGQSVSEYDAEAEFADMIAAGRVPGLRAIKALGCGQGRAKELQAHLGSLVTAGK